MHFMQQPWEAELQPATAPAVDWTETAGCYSEGRFSSLGHAMANPKLAR